MAFTFVTDEGKKTTAGKPKENKPVGAFSRGAVEGGLGSYGNIASLIPGYESGQVLPGQQAQHQLESNASPEQLPGLAEGGDVAPHYGTLPNSEQVSKFLDMLGIKKQEESTQEQGLGRFGRSFGGAASIPGIGLKTAFSTAFTGSGLAELAKSLGASPKVQNITEILGSLRAGGNTPVKQLGKIKQPNISAKNISAKSAGFITPDRLTQQLAKVGEDASKIASDIGSSSPTFKTISNSIKHGAPIQKKFDNVFSGLEDVAQHFNPPINTSKLDSFLTKEAAQYSKTGAPTGLSTFVNSEVQGWQKEGASSLYNVYKRYRLNNQRIREIIDSTPSYQKMSALQKQQISFLSRMNDSIKDSFKDSLSSNLPAVPGQTGNQSSLWLKTFEDSNKAYGNYQNTKMATKILDPILHGNITDKQITSFLGNERNWEDLERFLGKDETSKLKGVLQDLQLARNSLQSIPKKEVSGDLMKHALFYMIPKLGPVMSLLSLPKAWQWAKGRYSSSTEFQSSFHDLAKALSEKNIPAIRRASEELKSDKKEPKKGFTFVPEN